MAPRSLLQLLTITAAAAVFTETAQAAVYQAPDLNNPLESRIQALRDGVWQPQLNQEQGEQIARYWGNGGGRAWGNGGGWRNGGGWGNGGWGNVLPGSFINW